MVAKPKDDLQGIHENSQVRAEFHDIDGVTSVVEKNMKKFTKINPRTTTGAWLEQLNMGPNRLRFETCWHKKDDDTSAYIRAIQGHCSRSSANPEFFKNMIEIPQGWTNVICHSSSQQYLD